MNILKSKNLIDVISTLNNGVVLVVGKINLLILLLIVIVLVGIISNLLLV
jgi:hypothetical protein